MAQPGAISAALQAKINKVMEVPKENKNPHFLSFFSSRAVTLNVSAAENATKEARTVLRA